MVRTLEPTEPLHRFFVTALIQAAEERNPGYNFQPSLDPSLCGVLSIDESWVDQLPWEVVYHLATGALTMQQYRVDGICFFPASVCPGGIEDRSLNDHVQVMSHNGALRNIVSNLLRLADCGVEFVDPDYGDDENPPSNASEAEDLFVSIFHLISESTGLPLGRWHDPNNLMVAEYGQ